MTTIPQPVADGLKLFSNIRMLTPDEEVIALGLIETLRSVEKAAKDREASS